MAQILLTASSRHGATAEIGTRLAEELRGHGHQVDHRPPEQVDTAAGHDALVIGGAVYAGSWPKGGIHAVDRLTAGGGLPPTWVFSSGPVGDPLVPDEVPGNAQKQADRLGAVEHRIFAGRVDRSLLSLPERAILRVLKVADGDYRPWDEIAAWAASISVELADR